MGSKLSNLKSNSGANVKKLPKSDSDSHRTKPVSDNSPQKVGTSVDIKKVDRSFISGNDTSVDSKKMDQQLISGENPNGNSHNVKVSDHNGNRDMFHRANNRGYQLLEQRDEGKWQGNYDFICIGDPQIGFYDQKKEEDFSRKAVAFINKRKPKFVVVCGDHTHNLEGIWSKGDVELGRKKRIDEIKAYKNIYSKLDKTIPLVCVCGNHDVGNKPTKETTQLYTDEFGDDYLAFWCGGVKFIVLNSQIIQGLEESNELAIAHEEWFNIELEKHRDADRPVHLVAMCHIPPFCYEMEESYTNFNWPLAKRKKWLDKLVGAGVKKFYCAHYHHRSGGKYEELEVVVASALGTYIKRKAPPADIQGDPVKKADFMLAGTSFGGLELSEDTSGLLVVTVTQEHLSEEWLTLAQMNKEIGANEAHTSHLSSTTL